MYEKAASDVQRLGRALTTFTGEPAFSGLPGFIADALPDGWGMLLMDRAIGAFSFEPAEDAVLPAEILELNALADEVNAMQVAEDRTGKRGDALLRHLLRLGGSPQGARPKVLAQFSVLPGVLTSGMPRVRSATPWLTKFPAQGEHREVCAIEELYARVARQADIEMPRTRFFSLGVRHSAYGVQRFDRLVRGNRLLRIPVMSMSAFLQADHRLPLLDYGTVLLATMRLTGDKREVLKVFRRCVFNVLMHNRDDHSKNCAFRLNEQGRWQLSPAFDLTYSFGPGGDHATSVAGHGTDITRAHLLRVAKSGDLSPKLAQRCIGQVISAVKVMSRLVRELEIRKATMRSLLKSTAARIELVK